MIEDSEESRRAAEQFKAEEADSRVRACAHLMLDAIVCALKAIYHHHEKNHPMTASEVIMRNALISAVGFSRASELLNPKS